jgi:hypothetical protein
MSAVLPSLGRGEGSGRKCGHEPTPAYISGESLHDLGLLASSVRMTTAPELHDLMDRCMMGSDGATDAERRLVGTDASEKPSSCVQAGRQALLDDASPFL